MEKMKSTKKRKPAKSMGAKSVVAPNTEAAIGVEAAASADVVQVAALESTADANLDSKIYLEASLEIKDVEDARRRLMATLAPGAALTVDMSRVGAVDTAGAQLLLAFQSEATKRGMSVRFCGESAALRHALTVLGLLDAVQIATAHD